MKLNMELLYDSLEQYRPKTHFLSGDSSLRLIGPRLWGGEASVKPDYVYLATAERLMTCDNISMLGNIICLGCNQYLLHSCEGRVNIIALDSNLSLLELFSEVAGIFERFSDYDRDFLMAIAERKPLDDILQKASRFFGNPMILLDSSMMRIALVSEVDGRHLNPDNWRSLLTEGHVEPALLKSIEQRARQSQLTASRSAKFSSLHPNRYSAISVQIYAQDKRIGTLAIPEEFRKLNRGFLALADYVAKELSCAMTQNLPQRKELYGALEQFFKNLFSGISVDKSFLRLQLQQLHWRENDTYLLLVAELNAYERSGTFYHYGAKGLKNLLGDCFYLSFETNQVYVINTTHTPLAEETLTQLCEVLSKRDTYAGVSMETSDLTSISSQYVLAKEALRIGKATHPGDRLYFYRDYVIWHMLDMQSRPPDMSAICHPAVRRLYEHDREHGTEYINTFYIYLRSERSPTKAAKALFIHKNSLAYRIDRINGILNCGYEEPNLRAHLLISCQLLRYYDLKLSD